MRLSGLSLMAAVLCTGAHAQEGGCHKCQVIREENKKKVNPYEYYEDYVKDNPTQKENPKRPTQSTENPNRSNSEER